MRGVEPQLTANPVSPRYAFPFSRDAHLGGQASSSERSVNGNRVLFPSAPASTAAHRFSKGPISRTTPGMTPVRVICRTEATRLGAEERLRRKIGRGRIVGFCRAQGQDRSGFDKHATCPDSKQVNRVVPDRGECTRSVMPSPLAPWPASHPRIGVESRLLGQFGRRYRQCCRIAAHRRSPRRRRSAST